MYFVELLIHPIESFIYLGKTNKHGGTENDYQTCGDDDYDNHFIRQVHTSIVPMIPRKN